ncbi:LuxR C-terminal-related transcriptional regulator [Streptomyces sp. A1499]|uniref:helix-turn-helix domain-containing protein n=1 Tax=Streptomyces sp. A1499 TaxID=2563104 RepID=UPI00109EACD6|nr:LuxR C-terminal-related transcriptional regulator [Streptomyces sp. A1499]THC50446.1 response regulator transcription factor [Streptomyces sp. A1499]
MAEPAAEPADVTAAASRWGPELDRVALLSEREKQVFSLLGAGYSNRGIASRLRVTERTVKAHVAGILAKLDVESRLQVGLVAQVYQLMYQGTVSHSDALPEN